MTKMLGQLPKNPARNGLDAIRRQLVDNPEQEHLIIAVIDCKSFVTDTDTGEKEPTVRVLTVEAVNTADGPDAQLMLRRALEKRTGRTVLEGIDFEDVDLDTGEVRTG